MKRKIVINVPMHCEKAQSKAMKIAVAMQGVISVSIRAENDLLEVIGEGVDSVCLAKSLRKKFCLADVISVEEVKPPKPPEKKPTSPKPEPCQPRCHPQYPPCNYPPPCQPFYYECWPVYDAGPPSCSIL